MGTESASHHEETAILVQWLLVGGAGLITAVADIAAAKLRAKARTKEGSR